VVLLALAANVGPRFGVEVFAIRGGSKTPTIPVGAAVFAVSAEPGSIRAGDIVTIRAENGVVYTHRVVEVDDSEADIWLHTKGDANTTADAAPVPLAAVVGKIEVVVPLAGYLIALLATPAGIVSFLAYAVALLLVIGELEGVGTVADRDRQPRFARVPDVTRS
jgi:signal peptidase I